MRGTNMCRTNMCGRNILRRQNANSIPIYDREEILSTMSTRECIMSAPVLLLVHGDHYHFKANTVDIPYIMRVDDTVNNKALSLANDEFISSSESL